MSRKRRGPKTVRASASFADDLFVALSTLLTHRATQVRHEVEEHDSEPSPEKRAEFACILCAVADAEKRLGLV